MVAKQKRFTRLQTAILRKGRLQGWLPGAWTVSVPAAAILRKVGNCTQIVCANNVITSFPILVYAKQKVPT